MPYTFKMTEPSQLNLTISCSKILHKSSLLHPLARFVTEETLTILFNISPEDIYRIECYRHVVYIHAKGISRFVNYADFPPLLAVELPNPADFDLWHKRWKSQIAPEIWTTFYTHQLTNAYSLEKLYEWGIFIGKIKSEFSPEALQQLRDIYALQKYWRENFSVTAEARNRVSS